MNSFEAKFFKKYVPEGHEIQDVLHNHPLNILAHLFLWIGLGVLVPVIVYYYSQAVQDLAPFLVLESYLYLIYIKIIYDVFDWYNDVWIVTHRGVIELDWQLFRTKLQTIEYNDIEGIEVVRNSIIDKIFNKGDLVIHKIGDDSFALYDTLAPFRGLNTIEELKQHSYDDDDGEYGNEKFDIIMDALGGVVETYLDKKTKQDYKTHKEEEDDQYIERYSDDDNTIDLR